MSASNWDPALVAEFQAAVRAWLDRTGLSQKQAAWTCGFSQAVLNRWLQEDGDLVQPQPPLLSKLAPHIGIPLDELLRMAGHREDPLPVSAKPMELVQFLRDQEAGYWAAAEHERSIRIEVARAALPHIRRPNRRIRGNNAGLGPPKSDSRTHKSAA